MRHTPRTPRKPPYLQAPSHISMTEAIRPLSGGGFVKETTHGVTDWKGNNRSQTTSSFHRLHPVLHKRVKGMYAKYMKRQAIPKTHAFSKIGCT